MQAKVDSASLINDALAPPRQAPKLDMIAFLAAAGLNRIGPYTYAEPLAGGGTNFTAVYTDGVKKAVAKFFFSGPTGAGDAACHRELKMLKLCQSHEMVFDIAVSPRIIQEFASADGFVVGFLMEYVEGQNLWQVMRELPPGDLHAALTTFVRVGWALHNALRGAILHKDLHPGNIVFEMPNEEWQIWIRSQEADSPRVRILDFGSAVMPLQFGHGDIDDEDWYRDLMRYSNGAFTCVAPEFFTKDFWKALESPAAFDCWALGLLLYRLCTGKPLLDMPSAGGYCDLIHSGQLLHLIETEIHAHVADERLQFLLKSMLQPDFRQRVSAFNAIAYAYCLQRQDPEVLHLRGEELHRFVYVMGCDPEWDLPPHERSNSGY
jgi:serine/threonine protein kinase